MSKQPIVNAAIVKIRRKRAPVWPFATRSLCERVVKLLAEDEFVKELPSPENPPLDGIVWQGLSTRKEAMDQKRP
jgi:hypothetical protein